MKILLQYLKPYKWLVVLVLILAAMNIGFSLIDPYIFGKLVNLANAYIQAGEGGNGFTADRFFWSWSWQQPGVIFLLACSIGVAMVSRLAKNFQDYFLNVIVQKFG